MNLNDSSPNIRNVGMKDPETLRYYRSLFRKHLEGKELREKVDYVLNHSNKWLRIFRHYI